MNFKKFNHNLFLLFIIFFLPLSLFGRTERRLLLATRTDSAPNIDGNLNDPQWNRADVASNFFQYEPYNNKQASFHSEVRVLYDDNSIFIGAFLHDPQPDSILTELGLRDADDRLNADQFWVDINPFNDGLNSFRFKVSASGVQTDVLFSAGSSSRGDINWDAVWKSSVSIVSNGWIVEMEIPYSALRFPKTTIHEWAINFWREVRRTRESSSWNFVDRSIGNPMASKGILKGMEGISPPLRLTFFPYLSSYVQKNGMNHSWKGFVNGGMDLKYGVSESFTLDVALIPDFGQVKSDDQVLNLTPFEIKFDENRQFFTEGVDLFSKVDLFYSRRIGSTPTGSSLVNQQLQPNEIVKENPSETRLINATKLSGRTTRGLGVGFFNSMTGACNATLLDTITNLERNIRTQPFTNYSLVVFDQSLPNNSSVSFVNTNVTGSDDGYVANVTGTEFRLNDKSNMFRLSGSAAMSNLFRKADDNSFGFKYNFSLGKFGGNWQYSYYSLAVSDTYNQNDMGFMHRNNRRTDNIAASFNLFNPMSGIINTSMGLNMEYSRLFKPSAFTDFAIGYNSRILFTSRLFLNLNATYRPKGTHDYYEPRTPGMFYKTDPELQIGSFFSTDYRKKVFFDGRLSFSNFLNQETRYSVSINIAPTFRASDRLNISYGITYGYNKNDIGFVDKTTESDILFGMRNQVTTTNTLKAVYIINNRLSFDIQLRQYWSRVLYTDSYFSLQEDGFLDPWSEVVNNNDINYNIFTLDSRFIWNFAPGSQLSLVWKNNIESRNNIVPGNFFENLQNTLREPQVNSISVKILYFIDYQKIRNFVSG